MSLVVQPVEGIPAPLLAARVGPGGAAPDLRLETAAGLVVRVRGARPADVPAMMELLDEFARRGSVLPRTPAQLYRHIREFTVAVDATGVVGCVGLRLYSATLGELCALAVTDRCHGKGIGRRLVHAVVDEARDLSIRRLFALTLQESFFARVGFRTVPRAEIPEKIEADRLEGIDRTACRKVAVLRDL